MLPAERQAEVQLAAGVRLGAAEKLVRRQHPGPIGDQSELLAVDPLAVEQQQLHGQLVGQIVNRA